MSDPWGPPADIIQSVTRALHILDHVGGAPGGLSIRQIARECRYTVAATSNMVRTLTYTRYLARRDNGVYVLGLEIADRYRELRASLAPPPAVRTQLKRLVERTGYTHFTGQFVGGRIVVTEMVEGGGSPRLDLIPGTDDIAHATALGKVLLDTLSPAQRTSYLIVHGMRAWTPATIVSVAALDADLVRGRHRGMQTQFEEYQTGLACAAVLLHDAAEPERRIALACAIPAAAMPAKNRTVRSELMAAVEELNSSTDGHEVEA